MNNKSSVVIPLSWDPITKGHKNLIEQAISKYPDKRKIVAIGKNIDKKWLFTTEEKIDLIRHDLGWLLDQWDIEIAFYEGLLTDYAYENDAIVVRWIRNDQDKTYEDTLHKASKSQVSGYETDHINANPEYADISSSIAKALAAEYGDISWYTSLYVKQRVENKMHGQHIAGLTWSIAAGKSTVANHLEEMGRQYDIPVHNIDRDNLAKEVYTSTLPVAAQVREKLIALFGEEIRTESNSLPHAIDTKKLAEKFFADANSYKHEMADIFRDWILNRRRKALRGKKGVILANAALLADYGLSHLSNNHTILVGVNPEEQVERLRKRNWYTDVEIQQRLISQDNYEVKRVKLLENIEKHDGEGKVVEFDNSGPDVGNMKKEVLFNNLIADIDTYGLLRMGALCKRIPDEKVRNSIKPEELLAEIKWLYDANGLPYHNRQHIMEVWNDFRRVKHRFSEDCIDKIQRAILFHDIVYKTTGTNRETRRNEEESWLLARDFLERLGFDSYYILEVMDYIKNTKHRDMPVTKDGKLLKDLDMKILASDEKKYDVYKSNIRKEWHMFNDEQYKWGRTAFLKDQASKQIFLELTEHEDAAKANIQRELSELTST